MPLGLFNAIYSGSAPKPVKALGYALDLNGTDEYTSFSLYGSQIAANNSFVNWSGGIPVSWTKQGTTNGTNYIEEVPDDSLHIVSDGATMGVSQNILTIGARYKVILDVTVNSGTLKMQLGTGGSATTFNTTGVFTYDKYCDGTDGLLYLVRNAACNVVVNSVEVYLAPASLLNFGTNLITNHCNWNFEQAANFNWATGGNHAVSRSASNVKWGGYSLKVVVTGTGDATTNNASLATTYFTIPTAGSQYQFQFWVFPDTASRTVNWQIGDKSGSQAITGNASNLIKVVFTATASTNEAIKIWFTGGNLSAYIDVVLLCPRQDFAISAWFKKSGATGGMILGRATGVTATDYGFFLGFKGDSNLVFETYQGADTQTLTKANITDTNWHLVTVVVTADTGRLYVDGTLEQEDTTFTTGDLYNVKGVFIGALNGSSQNMNGLIGEVQFIRFTKFSDSDYDPTKYFIDGLPQSVTGGTPVIDLHYKWQGATDEAMLTNSGSLAVTMAGNNVTQALDQVRAQSTYYTRI